MKQSDDIKQIRNIIEAVLMTADRALSLNVLRNLFEEDERPSLEQLRAAITLLQVDYSERGLQLVEIAGGYRFQSNPQYAPWILRLDMTRPPRYSRALLETLALIAYRQPITRAEIEAVRGVAVSSNIMRTLVEREWVKVLGHRQVPGKPALYGTTRQFLDYFNLSSLEQLPALTDLTQLENILPVLELKAEEQASEALAEDDTPLH